MPPKSVISASRLRELVDYDPESGLFTAKKTLSPRAVKGRVLGCRTRQGYIHITLDRRAYKAHRLVWLFVHGVWPRLDIDHVNGNKDDNRQVNIRLATDSQNGQNQRRAHPRSLSGMLGVRIRGKRFEAKIHIEGKDVYLGRFDTAVQAHEAYLAAKRELHPFGEVAKR